MIILRQRNYAIGLNIDNEYQTYNENSKTVMSPGMKRLMSVNPLYRMVKGKPSQKKQTMYSDHEKLYKEWKKTKDPKVAYKWSQAYNKAYDKHKNNLPEPDPEIMKSVDEYVKKKDPKKHKATTEWNNAVNSYWSGKNYNLNPETAKYMRKATKGAEITEKIISKSNK